MGSIPFGYLFGRFHGIDIREHGSGNIGATNVWRILGKKSGIPCFILDVLKGLIPTIIGLSLLRFEGMHNPLSLSLLSPFSEQGPVMTVQIVQVITGLCAILGHNYSPWVNFKGGKGIATSLGVLIALMPFAILILLAVWGITFFLSRYVSLASVMAAAALPIVTITGSWFHGKIANGTWNKPLFVFSVIISLLAILKHHANIKRLLNGTESRFSKKAKS